MFRYFAYGLGIESELPFPELVSTQAAADISIRLGKVDWLPDEEAACVVDINAERMRFFWKGVGTFLARDGREIVVDPVPETEDYVVRLFVLGAVLAGVLHQRGLLLLHASAVKMGGSALAFVGEKGQGKSTVAAVMQARGHNLISDDVVAVETNHGGGIRLFPSYPQFKLWPDAVREMGLSPEKLPLLHPQLEKRAHRLDSGFSLEPHPLKGICVLEEGEQLDITALSGREAFVELVRHSYIGRHINATGASGLHFRQCSEIINSIPVYRLKRPRDLRLLPDTAAILEEHFG